jgi:hypothetical protein
MKEENKNLLGEPVIEYEDSVDQLQLEKPLFDPKLIKIETKTPSLDTLINRIKRESVQLNTDTYFQRQNDLWDKTRQSRLIESILIRFPLPAFFFDATDDDNWLVVDGLQRLSSIRNFVVNQSLALTNLEFLTHLNGKKWAELPENLRRVIEETQVVIYKIMPGTPTDVKFNIFKRINTGGLILEAQEIRHALFQGKPARFIYELASSEAFKRATNHSVSTDRMEDRAFANRFLSFYLFGVERYGTKESGSDLDTFLSYAMAALYDKTEQELQLIRSDFDRAMEAIWEIFGEDAFRRITGVKSSRINKALFDALSTQVALLGQQELQTLLLNKDFFRELFRSALADNKEFIFSITSATAVRARVQIRHDVVRSLIEKSIAL